MELRSNQQQTDRGAPVMMRRFNWLLVAYYVISDLLLGAAAFTLAYLLRFETLIAELIPVTKGKPPFGQYVDMLPFIGCWFRSRSRSRASTGFGAAALA